MRKKLLVVSILLAFLHGAIAGLVVDNTEPTDTISQQANSGNYTRIFDPAANDSHGRGMLFNSGAGGDIEAITLIKNGGTQTFNTDTVQLWIFSGVANGAAWSNGDGDGDGDVFDGTGATILGSQSFTLNSAIDGGDYMHFELDTPVTAAADTTYGFFFKYAQGSGPTYAQIGQDNAGWDNTQGALQQIQVTTGTDGLAGGNNLSTTSLQYYVSIPEPATMGMVALFGGGILFIRRRLML